MTFKLVAHSPVRSQAATGMATLPQLARLGTGRPPRLCCAYPYRLEGEESILTSSMPRPPSDWGVVASGVGTQVWDPAMIGVGAVFGTQPPQPVTPEGSWVSAVTGAIVTGVPSPAAARGDRS